MDNNNLSKEELKSADTLNDVLARIAYLEKCEKLLCEIYADSPAYAQIHTISDDIWNKMQNHFHFDDSP